MMVSYDTSDRFGNLPNVKSWRESAQLFREFRGAIMVPCHPLTAIVRLTTFIVLCGLCPLVTSSDNPAKSTSPLRVELQIFKSTVADNDFLVVEVTFINDSKNSIVCYNSSLNPLLTDRVVFLNLLDSDDVFRLDLLERQAGSFVSPRNSDWREIPGGATVSKTLSIPMQKIIRTAKAEIGPGTYALQVEVFSGMLDNSPWTGDRNAHDNGEPAGLRAWQKTLPGKLQTRSKKVYFDLIPAK